MLCIHAAKEYAGHAKQPSVFGGSSTQRDAIAAGPCIEQNDEYWLWQQ